MWKARLQRARDDLRQHKAGSGTARDVALDQRPNSSRHEPDEPQCLESLSCVSAGRNRLIEGLQDCEADIAGGPHRRYS